MLGLGGMYRLTMYGDEGTGVYALFFWLTGYHPGGFARAQTRNERQ